MFFSTGSSVNTFPLAAFKNSVDSSKASSTRTSMLPVYRCQRRCHAPRGMSSSGTKHGYLAPRQTFAAHASRHLGLKDLHRCRGASHRRGQHRSGSAVAYVAADGDGSDHSRHRVERAVTVRACGFSLSCCRRRPDCIALFARSECMGVFNEVVGGWNLKGAAGRLAGGWKGSPIHYSSVSEIMIYSVSESVMNSLSTRWATGALAF